MDNFKEIKDINTLYLIKESLFTAEYILTDNNYNYGSLIFDGLSRRVSDACSAYGNWKFDYDFEPYGNRYILISDSKGDMLGKATKYDRLISFESVTLLMNDGFKADFYKTLVFGNRYNWGSTELGDILSIKKDFFSLQNTITIINNDIPESILALLCLLAQHLLVLEKSR